MDTDTERFRSSIKDTITELLDKKKVPENGWNITTIEYLLSYLSSMDSNNFVNKASVGEREGRCFSDLVARRNYYLTHGIGRSGDLTEPQPKAAGSSVLYKLTNMLLKDLMTIYNMDLECLLVPLPIGISLVLCLNMYRLLKPLSQYVIWFREDDEIIFKAIVNAGFIAVVLNPLSSNNKAGNKLDIFLEKNDGINSENITCVISSTTCILPREMDDIRDIAKICKRYNIPHVLINKDGLQNIETMCGIKEAYVTGSIDVILQSTSANFLVPAGSTLVTSSRVNIIEKISKIYPGRASSSLVMDVLITLLSLGKTGYTKLLNNRKDLCTYLQQELLKLSKNNMGVVNTISFNLSSIALSFSNEIANVSFFKKLIRPDISIVSNLVINSEEKTLCDYKFEGRYKYTISNIEFCTADAFLNEIGIDI